ncbi:TerC family protein [Rhizobium rhizophilum]|uniref:TerC family protein n=1 Tax=Rhizobium rhizophilum TaxID=1850373 RepID=UPI001F25679E|nr:hypothetical protein [Rhizobium rhizophilum]
MTGDGAAAPFKCYSWRKVSKASTLAMAMAMAMDNIFVIALIFSFFAILRAYQHRVLFWGIRFCNHW